jgi:F0F1-type ATP synthase membrane subunit c/vacuolar-type H+-ATPase subunit K
MIIQVSYSTSSYKFLKCDLLFIKAAKVLSLSFVFMPLMGCAVATGLIFASLIKGISYAPDLEEVLFNYTTLGFAFVESFAFLLFFVALVVVFI